MSEPDPGIQTAGDVDTRPDHEDPHSDASHGLAPAVPELYRRLLYHSLDRRLVGYVKQAIRLAPSPPAP